MTATFSTTEAAALSGYTRGRINLAIKDGELPAAKVQQGARQVWAIEGADLAEWLNTQRLYYSARATELDAAIEEVHIAQRHEIDP